ncbi:MAG: hypothetical protein ACE5KT_09315, partial [Methanosarcinales archaeon]
GSGKWHLSKSALIWEWHIDREPPEVVTVYRKNVVSLEILDASHRVAQPTQMVYKLIWQIT